MGLPLTQVVFYGDGGGKIPASAGGGRLVLQETIAPAYVAPLELFYDASGTIETSFDTPLVYRWAAGGQTCSIPSRSVHPQLCYLLNRNRALYDISWAPPHAPAGTFQDHIPYDLVAQYLLGATAEQLATTFKYHETHEGLQPSMVSKA